MKHISIFCIFFLSALFTGCIREDLEPCNTFLYFSYLGDENREIFPDKIGKVNLYVYNVNDALVEAITLEQHDLSARRGIELNLPDGLYKVVCWGNSYVDTQINNPSARGLASVAAPRYFTGETISTNDSLYVGIKDIEIDTSRSSEDTVYFSSAHIKMQIEVLGTGTQKLTKNENIPFRIEVGNLSSTVNFNKNFSEERTSYLPSVSSNEEMTGYTSRFNVLRFEDENDIMVSLKDNDSQATLYTLNLQQFMKEYGISVHGKNEVLVGIRFRFNGMAITVVPWNEENIKPGIGNMPI